MSCDITGRGCKVCPGMWIAGLVLAVMLIQSLFFRSSTPPTAASANAEHTPQQLEEPAETRQ